MGGLGNQMFQYAAGRSLASRLGADLKLDLSFLEALHDGNTPRSYELDCFTIAAEIASEDDVAAILGKKTIFTALRAKLRKRLGSRWQEHHLYREPHCQYDPYFERLPDNTYLAGFWQSERYFAPIADTLAREFSCRHPLSGRNLEIAAEIDKTESVSIHVRRGDYVTDRATNQFHGVCGLDHYKAAVAEIVSRIREPHFFVFSDDHEWVKEHLLFDYPTVFVDYNGADKGYEDMRLMSLCRHNIIANSSFSWWGAWLNRNPGKTVIAPRKWFNSPDQDTRDLIPAGWLTV
jgi:hypothetical protein